MTREVTASASLTTGELPLLALHRHAPERSLPELLTAALKVGDPVRAALFHLQGCDPCARLGDAQPCERGAALIAACAGWRPRPGDSGRVR